MNCAKKSMVKICFLSQTIIFSQILLSGICLKLFFPLLAILQKSDLEKTSSKEVRNQLQEKLSIDLTSRKKELDKIIMECVNAMQDSESSSSESETEVKPKKRKAESSEESDYKPAKAAKKKRGSSSDSDEDYSSKKKKAGAKKGKYTGFTRPYKLSPELASLMGAKELPRHEVVKKVWAIIKEKNLYDPKNKQFAICDAALEKVIGVKRFRTFGMMKYLSQHLIK